MHRTTPVDASFRSYSAGGARSVVEKVDDSKLMQEVTAHFMNRESAEKVEAPQNYGFTSYTVDAEQNQKSSGGGGGQKTQGGEDPNYPESGAETFIMFVGGNRSFPVAFPIDDRRHRLKDLQQGDVAIYRLKDDLQQFHMTKDGTYWSTREDKDVRVALVPKPKQQQQSSSQQQQGASGAGGQQSEKLGQKDLLDENKKSKTYTEQNKDHFIIRRGSGWVIVTDDYVHIYKGQKQQSSDDSSSSQADPEPDKDAVGGHIYVTDDHLHAYIGKGHTYIADDEVVTTWGPPGDESVSTKVDSKHAHIRFKGNRVWVDGSGCYSTVKMNTKGDPDGGQQIPDPPVTQSSQSQTS